MPDQLPPTIKQQRDLKQQEKERRRQASARHDRTKNIITWSIVGAVAVGIVALIIISSRGSGSPSGAVVAVTDQDHVRGPVSAKAVIIEYSDFQCPACGAYYPTMKNLEKKYGDQIAIVYRNFPLTSLHKNAQLAAQAAEAANLQGKFWEMHDRLFERQEDWSTLSDAGKTFGEYAKELNLDVTRFSADLTSSPVKDRVTRDVDSGNAVNIAGTPTFFMNGKKLTNPGSEDVFSSLIDAELGTANQ